MTELHEPPTMAIELPPMELSDRQQRDLLRFSQEAWAKLFKSIQFSRSSGAVGTKIHTLTRSTRATTCVDTRIRGSLEEVASFFMGDRTSAAIGFAQSQLLLPLLSATPERPLLSCGVRWSLWESPAKFIRPRDLCYVEYMDSFIDDRGRRGWARCTQSIDLRSCPSLLHSHQIVRGHLYCSGVVYTESSVPGELEVTTLYDMDTGGIPAWMARFVALRKAKNADNLGHLIRLSRITGDDTELFEHKKEELAAQRGKFCHGCNDEMSRWTKSRRCRNCNQRLCKNCSAVVYGKRRNGDQVKRICVHCVFSGTNPSFDVYSEAAVNTSFSRRQSRSGASRSRRESRPPVEDLFQENPSTRSTVFSSDDIQRTNRGMSYAQAAPKSRENGRRALSELPMPRYQSEYARHDFMKEPQADSPVPMLESTHTPQALNSGVVDLSYLATFKTSTRRVS